MDPVRLQKVAIAFVATGMYNWIISLFFRTAKLPTAIYPMEASELLSFRFLAFAGNFFPALWVSKVGYNASRVLMAETCHALNQSENQEQSSSTTQIQEGFHLSNSPSFSVGDAFFYCFWCL